MKILLIQTAFIGDVILATSLIEDLIAEYPDAQIDFLLRKGNQSLLKNHPYIHKLYVWDKNHKFRSQFSIIRELREEKYDYVFNLQRYMSSGLFTVFSGGKQKIGFAKNPLSFLFSKKAEHHFAEGTHEVDRNHKLAEGFLKENRRQMRLYPSEDDSSKVAPYALQPYYVIAPASVWFTKQWPAEKWLELIAALPQSTSVYLVGGPGDYRTCMEIAQASGRENVENLAGKFSLLQTAALMKNAQMNFVNDSAPLHLASAMNAPVRAVFCSTATDFGYTPLSDDSKVIEVENLACRPCGLHGHKSCPKGHFRCAMDIKAEMFF